MPDPGAFPRCRGHLIEFFDDRTYHAKQAQSPCSRKQLITHQAPAIGRGRRPPAPGAGAGKGQREGVITQGVDGKSGERRPLGARGPRGRGMRRSGRRLVHSASSLGRRIGWQASGAGRSFGRSSGSPLGPWRSKTKSRSRIQTRSGCLDLGRAGEQVSEPGGAARTDRRDEAGADTLQRGLPCLVRNRTAVGSSGLDRGRPRLGFGHGCVLGAARGWQAVCRGVERAGGRHALRLVALQHHWAGQPSAGGLANSVRRMTTRIRRKRVLPDGTFRAIQRTGTPHSGSAFSMSPPTLASISRSLACHRTTSFSTQTQVRGSRIGADSAMRPWTG